jgi:hypothetical protein
MSARNPFPSPIFVFSLDLQTLESAIAVSRTTGSGQSSEGSARPSTVAESLAGDLVP